LRRYVCIWVIRVSFVEITKKIDLRKKMKIQWGLNGKWRLRWKKLIYNTNMGNVYGMKNNMV
jgi:hypothetical protein